MMLIQVQFSLTDFRPFLFCCFFLCAPVLSAQESPGYDALLDAYHSVHGFSGTVKIVTPDSAPFEQSYGLANRSFDVANTPETRFSINSVSKTFTALAIMQLVSEGKLDLNKPLSFYLPTLKADWKNQVSAHHLLTHTSGLPRESGIQPYETLSFQEQISTYINPIQLLFTPGERYEYSNTGITLLGALIEQVSGMTYRDFITMRIIHPLKLENTGVYEGRNLVRHQATPYRFTSQGIAEAQRTKHFGDNAGGGLYSTPADLYRFMLAVYSSTLIPQELTEQMFTPHVQSGGNDAEGYAWSIKQFGDETLYFAAGSGYGTKSVVLFGPETQRFIAITSNWGNTPILNLLRDLYLISRNQTVSLPDSNALARPEHYRQYMGEYHFEPEALKHHLGMAGDTVHLHEFENKLFMNEELLATKADGVLGLTYTDEVEIRFTENHLHIRINNNELTGLKIR